MLYYSGLDLQFRPHGETYGAAVDGQRTSRSGSAGQGSGAAADADVDLESTDRGGLGGVVVPIVLGTDSGCALQQIHCDHPNGTPRKAISGLPISCSIIASVMGARLLVYPGTM